ncbi:hypothetical protein PW5551_04400 [Petrotoga sp. 9PW.55.5.1]|uniref:hypothetical protein n=1 Tax=Petrotoga sp. 9PW.55.5.1 TaxID=1308979 RepID=UPI000DC3BA93|nr:hypothetical protein [Petrotoga sp. 9PW.55.5.1]RAO99381.1 hypothetical protein PW5551_04400 [Petrotoga sp. 9PW.55.5.1]
MRFYGWVLLSFLVFFVASFILYFSFGRLEINAYSLEKSPKFNVRNSNYDISYLDTQLKDIKNISTVSSYIIDKNFFVGNIEYNLTDNLLIVKPLNKKNYNDLRNLIVSMNIDFIESNNEYEFFGLNLTYYQLMTKNIYIELTPRIGLLSIDEYSDEIINILESSYNLYTKENYRPYSFNSDILNTLHQFGGVLIDEEILNITNIQPLFDILKEQNLKVDNSILVYSF